MGTGSLTGGATTVLVVLAGSLVACTDAESQLRPLPAAAEVPYLPAAHSHNNYDQPRPLLDALERGFASIEVDIALMAGELYVTHDPEDIDPDATLAGLYLEPLREVARRNGGSVYGTARPPLQLLVDVKTEAQETYEALAAELRGYSELLTAWGDRDSEPGAVSIVLSGNRAVERITSESRGHIAIDGRILDERSGVSVGVMPLVSADWEDLGPPVEEDRLARARMVVEQMHAEGRRVRFWATPEDEELWGALLAMGVDYIGTDDPARLERFIRDNASEGTRAIDD